MTKLYEEATFSKTLVSNAINMIGFEFDGTACFRKGTVDGPDAIREVSPGIEIYSPYLNRELPSFYDLGNLDGRANWEKLNQSYLSLLKDRSLKEENIKLLTLGGEHSISYTPIKSYLEAYSDLTIIHLDAHADLRDGYEGYHYSHASIIRRALDHFGNDHRLIQYGIRSGTKEEYEWMKDNNTLCLSRDEFLAKVKDITTPIYLTLDLDYFDPSYFPGTGTPEPGGEDFHSYIKLIKVLAHKNLVGADVVELSPSIDQTGNSSVFASKVVRELIIAMERSDS